MQTLAEQFGGQVTASKAKEFGHATITLENSLRIYLKALILEQSIDVWMSHGDHVSVRCQINLILLHQRPSAPIAAMAH